MAIGFLQLDPDYIERDVRGVKDRWFDEPKNSAVAFQFDPIDVKLVVPSKWKDEKPETATLLKIGMKYDRETADNQDKIELKLIFSDVVLNKGTISHAQLALTKREPTELPEGIPNTQRSLEILEAMALPVTGRAAQVIKSVYFREINPYEMHKLTLTDVDDVDAFFNKGTRPLGEERRGLSFVDLGLLGPSHRWHEPTSSPPQIDKITINGKKLVLAQHPPRPLVLHLITPTPFKCILHGLEIEILNLDTTTGAPIVAIAKVTLVEFNRELFEEGYDGLIQSEPINLGELNEDNEEKISLEDWNYKISLGAGIINETPPKKEFVLDHYKVSTQRIRAALEMHNSAIARSSLASRLAPRQTPSLVNSD